MSKQDTAGQRKHVTLRNCQKTE